MFGLGKGGSLGARPLPRRVRAILNKFNCSAHIPGVSGVLRFGYQPGNYRESTGQTLAGADQQVGLVVDAARAPGNNLVNPANWLPGSGTVISGGVATSTAVTAGLNIIQQDNVGVTSKMLEVTITIAVVSGSAQIRPGGVSGPAITASGTYTQRLQAGAADAFRVIAGASGFTGSITLSSISVRELPGIHATQSTSGFQPVLRNTSGIQSWQFDGSDDRFSMTFPSGAGWNNTTIITARSSGAVTETGQNVEGTHLFQVSGHVYGRFYIPNGSTISASELAALQRFANVLSGYSA